MFLISYLRIKGIPNNAFAELININKGSIHNWITGRKRPSYTHADQIVKATNGMVTLNDLSTYYRLCSENRFRKQPEGTLGSEGKEGKTSEIYIEATISASPEAVRRDAYYDNPTKSKKVRR